MPECQSFESLEGRARLGRVLAWAEVFELLMGVARG
jgi:hypothetical protein